MAHRLNDNDILIFPLSMLDNTNIWPHKKKGTMHSQRIKEIKDQIRQRGTITDGVVEINGFTLQSILQFANTPFKNFVHNAKTFGGMQIQPARIVPEKKPAQTNAQAQPPYVPPKTPVSVSEREKEQLDKLRAELAEQLPAYVGTTDAQSSAYRQVGLQSLSLLLGPAGTGKTRLAIHKSLELLRDGKVSKIVGVRPKLTVGGKDPGAYKGGVNEKEFPYVQPIYDIFVETIGKPLTEKLIKQGMIELKTPDHVRGKNEINCALILDEAQGCTEEELTAVITRPKATDPSQSCPRFISGDIGQNDQKHADLPLEYEQLQIMSWKIARDKMILDELKKEADGGKPPARSLVISIYRSLTDEIAELQKKAAQVLAQNGEPFLAYLADKLQETEFKSAVIQFTGSDVMRDYTSRRLYELCIIGGRREADRVVRNKIIELRRDNSLDGVPPVSYYCELAA